MITAKEEEEPRQKKEGKAKKKFSQMSEMEYLQHGYKDASIKDIIPSDKEFNGSVLASINTKLIGVIIDQVEFILYTVDSDLMIRVWDLSTGKCTRSYMIETRDDQASELNNTASGSHEQYGMKVQKKKAQLVKSDEDLKFLIVTFEAGEIQVNNLFSGALIYNNANVKPIKIDYEIAQIKFFNS